MGNKGLITTADWPSVVDFPLDEAAEVSELLVAKVIEDARNLLKIIKEQKKRLTIYVASDVASEYFLELAKSEKGGRKPGRGHQEVRLFRDKAREGDQAPIRARRRAGREALLSREVRRVRRPERRRALPLERDRDRGQGLQGRRTRRSRTPPTRRRTRSRSSPHSISSERGA